MPKKESDEKREIRLEKLRKIREKTKRYNENFRKEMKKSVLTAIVAAFGFLMALSWRELISSYIDEINSISPIQGQIVKVSIVTLISVIGIMIATKMLSEKSPDI
jgi:hypothetical protein